MQTKVPLPPALSHRIVGLWLGAGCSGQAHRAWPTSLRWLRAEALALATVLSLPTAGHKGLWVRELGPTLTDRNSVSHKYKQHM